MSTVVSPKTGRIRAWMDRIPLHYEYTAGAAGELFLRGLKEGTVTASKCTMCGEVRLPPRGYCLECGARTRVDVAVLHPGMLAAISREPGGAKGKPGRTFGFVTFAGVEGGMVHMILHEGRQEAKVGAQVMATFKPKDERDGSVLDLLGFRTAAKTPSGND